MTKRIETGSSILESTVDLTNASLAAIQRVDMTAVERDLSRTNHETAVADHEEAQVGALETRTAELEHEQTPDLLTLLADEYGFSWATIARALGVTPTAVRKWRRGEEATAANRQSVARLTAFVEIAKTLHPLVPDVSYWIEAPVYEKSSITRIELYRQGAIAQLFDLVAARRSGLDVLNEVMPNWRKNHLDTGGTEVVRNDDGSVSVVQTTD